MEIFISAGEASSDIHAARLVRELKKSYPDLTLWGLGGDALAAEKTELLMHNREFSAMGGPLEVIGLLPKRNRLEKMVEKRLFMKRPDLAIVVDNGEINLRLSSLLHFFKVPVVYFIPPKVWVWRHSRIEKIAQHVKLVLSILPFEKPMYEAWEIPFQYVGNPLIDEISPDITAEEARKKLGLDASKTYISVFPGSRHSEIKHHVAFFSAAIREFRKKFRDNESFPEILIPVAPAIDDHFLEKEFSKHLDPSEYKVHFIPNQNSASHLCLKASRAAIVKSGTSTLEAAVLGTPMVLSYESSASTKWIFKNIVGYKGFIGMVNLFLVQPAEKALGWLEKGETRPEAAVPEMILEKGKPDLIADAFAKIYFDGTDRDKMIANLMTAKKMLYPPKELGESPIVASANAILKLLENERSS